MKDLLDTPINNKEQNNRKNKTILAIKDIALISMFSALMAICSWISIPFVVPFTMQTFAVFLTLVLLGGFKGTLSILVYILLGLIGLPVFANFNGGLAYLMGPTGGYIVGFLLSGLIMWALEKPMTHKGDALMIVYMFIGLLVCYLVGTIWFYGVYLYHGNDTNVLKILSICVLPFIIPDLLKIILVLFIYNRLKKHINV